MKYNIDKNKPKKEPLYLGQISEETRNNIKNRILDILVKEGKALQKGYTASDLAREIGTNNRYLSGVFNEDLDTSFSDFVNNIRIIEAKKKLKREKGKTVAEIGEECGFSNRQSFYANFYKVTGITPAEYRDANTKKRAISQK